jgi:hypothetical protein
MRAAEVALVGEMRTYRASILGAALAAVILSTACTASPPAPGAKAGASEVASGTATGETSSAAPSASAEALARKQVKDAEEQEARRARFADLANDLSEPDAEFFSDNIISNETSYLQVADGLAKRAKEGGVYIGVGPEQNFTYIAISKPRFAFIVDIRRQNLLLHLLYKAAFEEARSRSHFVALMLGRAHDATNDGSPADTVDQVLAEVAKDPVSKESYETVHAALVGRIASYGVKLSEEDKKHIDLVHKAFFDGQLDLHFTLKEANGRKYPTLEEMLSAKTPDGREAGFLASEDSFRFLQTMEKEHRLIPIVGNFAGDHAMPGLASFLSKENLPVSVFYVSNVEEYLGDFQTWAKWTRNVHALPKDKSSLYVRAYLDQGKKHPLQMKGHRTATVLQSMEDFDTTFGSAKTATLYDISTTHVLD